MKNKSSDFSAVMKTSQICYMLKDIQVYTVMSSLIRIWLRWKGRRKQQDKRLKELSMSLAK
jgi:hypothetical protein